MKTARLLIPIFVVAALVAGCGGGSSAKLKGDDVAGVGGTHITNADFATVMAQAKQVQKRLDSIKKQYFQGSDKKYKAQLKKQKLNDAEVRKDIRSQLIGEALFAKLTKNVKVTNDEAAQYYTQHAQLYTKAQTRDVQYMLIKSKTLANSVYAQLKSGDAK